MILKYLFLCVTIVAVALGIRSFVNSTKDLIAYHRGKPGVFEKVTMKELTVLKQEVVKRSSTNNPHLSLVDINNRKIAILNIPAKENSFMIKRSPNLDAEAEQILSEPYDTFEAINNISFYFISRYIISCFLIIFGLVFLVAAYAIWKKRPLGDTSLS